MRIYEVQKIRSQTSEEYFKLFLDAEVLPFWPQGWMTTKILLRESKSAMVPERTIPVVNKPKKKPQGAVAGSTTANNNAAPRQMQPPPVNHIKPRPPSPDFGPDIDSFKNLLDYANDDINEDIAADPETLIDDLFKSASASDLLKTMSEAAIIDEKSRPSHQVQQAPKQPDPSPPKQAAHVSPSAGESKQKPKASHIVMTDFDQYARGINSNQTSRTNVAQNSNLNREANSNTNSMQSYAEAVEKYKTDSLGQLTSPIPARNLAADLIRSLGSNSNYGPVSQGHSISGTGVSQGNNIRSQHMVPPTNHPEQRLLSPDTNRQNNRPPDNLIQPRQKNIDTSPRHNNTNILGNILGQMGPISPEKNLQSPRHSPGNSYKTHQFTANKDSHPHSISMLTKPRNSPSDQTSPMLNISKQHHVRTTHSGPTSPMSPMLAKPSMSPMLAKPTVRLSPQGPTSPSVSNANDVRTLLRQQSDPLEYNKTMVNQMFSPPNLKQHQLMDSTSLKQHQLMDSASLKQHQLMESASFHHSPHLNLPRSSPSSVWSSPTSHPSSPSYPNLYSPQQSPSYQGVSISDINQIAKAEAVARAMDMAKAEQVARHMQSADRGNNIFGSSHSPRSLPNPISPHQSPRFPGLLPNTSPVRIRHPFGHLRDPNQSPHGY